MHESRPDGPVVSPEVSVIWKPLQRLFADGSPASSVAILYFDVGSGRRLPFAAITRTRRNRLVLWPPSDARRAWRFQDGSDFHVHHVTLELDNGTTHLTHFDASNNRVHRADGWRLLPSQGGSRLWLVGAFKLAVLEKQVGVVEQSVNMPVADSARRHREFERYASQLAHIDIRTPPVRGDCLIAAIHLLSSDPQRDQLDRAHFPMAPFWNELIDDWPDGDKFPVGVTGVQLGEQRLLVQTVSPLGRLRGACFLAGPTRERK